MHNEFEEAQAAAVAKTKRAQIEAIAHPFVSEVETVQKGMTTIGISEGTKSASQPAIETDVFGDTVTQPKEFKSTVELKKGKQIFLSNLETMRLGLIFYFGLFFSSQSQSKHRWNFQILTINDSIVIIVWVKMIRATDSA